MCNKEKCCETCGCWVAPDKDYDIDVYICYNKESKNFLDYTEHKQITNQE